MKSLIFALAFLCLISSLSAQKTTNAFDDIEKIYKKGDYKDALRKNKTLLNKLDGKNDNYLYTRALYQQAKIYDALSKFDDYTTSIYTAASSLSTLPQTSIEEYARTLCYAGQTYMEYGDYVNAADNIYKAKLLVDQKKIKNQILANDIIMATAWCFYYTGCFKKAVSLLTASIPTIRSVIKRTETYVDANGTQKTRKLSKAELYNRRETLGYAQYLLAKTYTTMEDIVLADSMIDDNDSYIRKNLGRKNLLYINNLLLEADLYEANNQLKKAGNSVGKAGKLVSKIKVKKYSRPSLAVQEKWVLFYKKLGLNHQANKRQRIMDVRARRYYGKYSIYIAHSDLLDIEKYFLMPDMDKEDYEKVTEKLKLILANTAYYPPVHKDKLILLDKLYKIQLANDDYTSAGKDLTDLVAMEAKVMGKEAPYYHLAQLEFAGYSANFTNNFHKAEELFNDNLQLVADQMGEAYEPYINNVYDFIKLYYITDQYEKAYKLAVSITNAVKKNIGEDKLLYAIALTKEADLEITLAKFYDAEKNLAKAEAVMRMSSNDMPENNIYYSNVLKAIARLHLTRGDYDKAEKNLKKAVRYSKNSSFVNFWQGQEERNSFDVSEEMALFYIQTGNYEEADNRLQASLEAKEAKYGKDSRELINPLNELGELNIITGSFGDAEKYIDRSLKISKAIFGDTSLTYGAGLDKLSRLYVAIGDYEKAEEASAKLLDIQRKHYGKKNIEVARTLNELALIKFYNNRNKIQTEELFHESLRIIKDLIGEENPEWADVTKNLSLFYMESGKLEKAEEGLNRANEVWTDKFGTNNVHSAEVHTLKGNIAYQRKKYAEAKAEYLLSRNIYSKIFDSHHPSYVKALSQAGKMNFILGEYKMAFKNFDETTSIYLAYIKEYFPSLSEREKTKFWNLIKPDFEFYSSLAIKLKDENPEAIGNMYNFALTTKALLLNSSIKVRHRILNSGDTSLIKKYENWVSKKEFLTSVLAMSPEQVKGSEIDPKTVEKDVENLERELSESSEVFASNYEKDNYRWKDVQAKLEPNEVSIEVIRFRKFTTSFTDTVMYAVLIVTPTTKTSPQLVLLEDGKNLETRYIKYYRNCIKHNIDDEFSYNNYWKPIEKVIANKRARIYFSPDGVYNQINIEALKTNNTYVIDSTEILLVNNSKEIIKRKLSIERQAEQAKSKKKIKEPEPAFVVDLFGNPTYYGENHPVEHRKISQLEGAEKEVNNINKLLTSNNWHSQVYVEKQATEETVKNLKSPTVLHIATHGFFMEDAQTESDVEIEGINEGKSLVNPLLKSGLLFKDGGYLVNKTNPYAFNSADGILTSFEAMNLNLDNTEIVVLSACETGLGEIQLGEGVYGLQRAFLIAGANSIIMSLFKVSDEVTEELMENFYKKWLETKDKRKAFLFAKKAIKDKYQDPLYWGSFVMIGVN